MRRLLALVLVTSVVAVGCARAPVEVESPVVVGVGSTTEQRVLAALTLVALDEAGLTAEVRPDLGGTAGLRREAIRRNIDVFWDYTGAAWALGLGGAAPPADPLDSIERVRRADEDNGLTWLEPSDADATLALVVRADALPADTEPRGLTWLARVLSAGEGELCADPDFIRRSGGLDALADAYAIDLEGRLVVRSADEDEAIRAVSSGRCFAGLATATSGVARAAGLVPVADDLAVFPAFLVAPVVTDEALDREPALAGVLEQVSARLDTRALAALNAEVESGVAPEEAAQAFLAGS